METLTKGQEVGNFNQTTINFYQKPIILDIIEDNKSIEIIYKEISFIKNQPPRIFKHIYTCVNGEFNKSPRIYGKYIPAQDEKYEFN